MDPLQYLLHWRPFLFCVLVQPSPPRAQPGRSITAAPSISADVPTPDRSPHTRWGGGRSTMDSSGYSSSEDPNRKPLPSASATSSASKIYGRIVSEYRPRINSALFALMGECEILDSWWLDLSVVVFLFCFYCSFIVVLYVSNRVDLAAGQPNTQHCECSSSRYGVRVNVHFNYTHSFVEEVMLLVSWIGTVGKIFVTISLLELMCCI